MNYFKLIKVFYDSQMINQLSTGQIALWNVLVYINNQCFWQEWFTSPNQTLELLTGLSKSAILKNRNALKQAGLIDFKINGTKACKYKIIDISNQESVQESTQVSEQDSTRLSERLSKPKVCDLVHGKCIESNTLIDKDIDININNKKEKGKKENPPTGEADKKINRSTSADKKTDFDNLINSYTDNDELKETIYEFIKMRTAIKKPMTTKALDILLNKLNTLASDDDTKIKVLEQSIEHSWQTVYELKERDNGKDIRNSGEFGRTVASETRGAEKSNNQQQKSKWNIKLEPFEFDPNDDLSDVI